jgi:D-galactarolactone cycloisomerase
MCVNEGAEMKIERVEVFLLEARLNRPFAYSRGWFDRRGAALIEITTDSGLVGWGEAFGPPRMSYGALEMLKPLLIERDPLQIEVIWQELYSRFREHGQKGPFADALSAVDIALWDIKGKHFGQPIHRLMGGPLRSKVPVYATGLFMRPDGNPENYLVEEALAYLAEGYNAIKLKVGFGLDYDVRAVRAVRSAIGKDPKLMVDANEAYDAVEAIRLARRIEQYDITWFEEPVPPEDLAGYREIKAAQSIPIAGGEAEFTRFGFREILVTRAMDIIQPDICAAGGISECKKIADMASAFGVRCNPHTWGTAIAIAASLQLLAVIPDTPFSLNPTLPMLELDRTEHGIRDALMSDVLRPEAGMIRIPEEPGLGISIDRDVVRSFAI